MALLIMIVSILVTYTVVRIAKAETVQMTASVRYNNCNIETTAMPVPEIIQTYENEYGYNFIAKVGDSLMFAIRPSQDTMVFTLDDATWSVSNGVYIAPECDLI